MKLQINMDPLLMTEDQATSKAKALQESDPDFKYVVELDPKGGKWCRIATYELDGNFVGYWS